MNITSHSMVSGKPDAQNVNQKNSNFRKVGYEELYRNILLNKQVNATATIAFGILGAAVAAGIYLALKNQGITQFPSKCIIPAASQVQVQPNSVQASIQCPATFTGLGGNQCSTDIRYVHDVHYVPQIRYLTEIRYITSNMTNMTVFDPKNPNLPELKDLCFSYFPDLELKMPDSTTNRMSNAVKQSFESGHLTELKTPNLVKSSAGNLNPGLVTAVATVAAIVLNLL